VAYISSSRHPLRERTTGRKGLIARSPAVLLLAWLVLCAGVCEMVPDSLPIVDSDLYGGYEANFHAGRLDSLYLLPDSTYVRVYETGEGRTFVDTGKWAWDYMRRDSSRRKIWVLLYYFRPRFDLDSASPNQPLAMRSATNDLVLPVTSLVVWKYKWVRQYRVALGQLYGAAWVKTYPITDGLGTDSS